MKMKIGSLVSGALLISALVAPVSISGQSQENLVKKYLKELPHGNPVMPDLPQVYKMTAIYTNRDLYGNFTGKQKISGEYTWGLKDGYVAWNNIYISGSDSYEEPFPQGQKQEYMENFKYIPSPEMLNSEAFKDFPASTETVFSKNLVWDMEVIENFAWTFSDSLQLNRKYVIPDINGEFEMADIGTYSHADIQLCWTGISFINNELCGVIEYRAIDNKIELSVDPIKTRGTEQYWGTTWVSLRTKQIEYAEMYGGSIQEIEIKGLNDKFLIKTIRVLWVERIK
jgi:hypothetical protein